MKVIELKYKDEFGKINKVNELYLLKDKGIDGDINSKKGKREISIFFVEKKEDINKKDYSGLCTNKFYENIIITGVNSKELVINQKLQINNSIIELFKTGKTCFNECILVRKNKKCILKDNVVFAKVIKGANIKIHDYVKKID